MKRNVVALLAALASGGALIGLPPVSPPRDETPAPLAVAWPGAERAALPATLPDGTAYQPALFLDARTSVGTAPSKDGKTLRLVERQGDNDNPVTVRTLRALPSAENPSYQSLTVAGGTMVWFESSRDTRELWIASAGTVRRLATDLGQVRTYRSENDLILADGRARWTASGPSGTTELRSVALTGGPVEVLPQSGTWRLAGWPWLVDGVTDTRGASVLRNARTGEEKPITRTPRAATDCSPTYCRVVSLDNDGWSRIELMKPDGRDRTTVAEGDVNTAVVDVAPLDRFEIYVKIGANSELTGIAELLIHEIPTNRTVQISPDAGNITYRAGILWWTAGNLETYVRHSLDLRTIP